MSGNHRGLCGVETQPKPRLLRLTRITVCKYPGGPGAAPPAVVAELYTLRSKYSLTPPARRGCRPHGTAPGCACRGRPSDSAARCPRRACAPACAWRRATAPPPRRRSETRAGTVRGAEPNLSAKCIASHHRATPASGHVMRSATFAASAVRTCAGPLPVPGYAPKSADGWRRRAAPRR